MKDTQKKVHEKLDKFPGYPHYPTNEDIYNQLEKKIDINPEDISKKKPFIQIDNTSELNEKDFDQDQTGEDLDIPGTELDDEQEEVGSEDEENNYYSIGGDNHNDLDEDKG
jgi:hypothetical protein